MTPRRVVALAQALTMSMLLLPGPSPLGPSPAAAAVRPVEPAATTVFDASGKGIGCLPGSRAYKGPGLPKDPPWPPGAEPTPSPTPSPTPAVDASAEPSEPAEPAETAAPTPDPEDEAAGTALVSGDLRQAQADTAQADTTQAVDVGRLVTGIDVSHHNGDIDYQAVKDAGHRFVYIKATQDNDFIDPMFPTNLARARSAGLSVGAYHFFDYTLDGREQADHFLDRVQALGGVDDALPPVVDVECWRPIGPSIHAVAAARLRDFGERVYERTGRMPMIYTSVHMWREVVGDAGGFEGQPLWAACWSCQPPPDLPGGWGEWTFWQEGLTRIPSVGRLDGNYFGGTRRALRALELRPLAIEAGAVAAAGGEVSLDLGGRDGTHIRTSPDGESWSEWSPIRGAPTALIPSTEGEHAVFAQLSNGPGLLSPVISDRIVVDRTPPDVSAPTVTLRVGPLSQDPPGVPVSVRWQAHDAVAGLSDAEVEATCGAGQVLRTEATGSAAPGETADWAAAAWLSPADECTIAVLASDGAGNRASASASGYRARVIPPGEDGSSVTEVTGQVGVVARRGPEAGRAVVLVDGEASALVDLYAPQAGGPEIIHLLELGEGPHSVAVEPTGSSHPASSGTSVVIEGFASLAR